MPKVIENDHCIISDLKNMYRLLNPISNGLGMLIQEIEDHIKQIGLEAISSLKGDNVSRGTVHVRIWIFCFL